MKYCYDNFIKVLTDRAVGRLNEIEGTYGFEYGVEFEIALCEILRDFLPNKYGICRGFVVDFEGNKAGDDIIIYDQERFPTLKLKGKEEFARKESIPIEAVYAYIEAKHTIVLNNLDNTSSLVKALDQIKNVKKLILKREKANINIDPKSEKELEYPKYSNPPFTLIWARRVSISNNSNITSDSITIDNNLWSPHINHFDEHTYPDCLIIGESNFYSSAYSSSDSKLHFPVFNLNKNYEGIQYGRYLLDNLAFGYGLAFLMTALDQIGLGKMPWSNIINEMIMKEWIKNN